LLEFYGYAHKKILLFGGDAAIKVSGRGSALRQEAAAVAVGKGISCFEKDRTVRKK
jgi:hypothetical protein